MIFSEIIERSRDRTVSKIKEAIADRSSRSKVHVEPALRMKDGSLAFAPDGLKLPMRWDFIAEQEPEEKNADSLTIKFSEPVYATWANDMKVEIFSICWDCMIFRLSKPQKEEEWNWLREWFMRWFDPNDEHDKDEDGLYQVVHFVSDPEPVDSCLKFVVDFGSAKIGALMDLLDRIAERGFPTCILGDENQPQQSVPGNVG